MNFGNPRIITPQKLIELKKSIERFDDFGVIVINELNQCISGNQRVQAMIELGIDLPILCKKLVGYSEKELKAINIKSNQHSGDWDYDVLNEWQKDLDGFELNIDFKNEEEIETKKINIQPYNMIHILISCPIQKIQDINNDLKKIKEKEFIEYEQSAN